MLQDSNSTNDIRNHTTPSNTSYRGRARLENQHGVAGCLALARVEANLS